MIICARAFLLCCCVTSNCLKTNLYCAKYGKMFQKSTTYSIFLTACFVHQVLASQQLTLSNRNLVVAIEPWPPVIVLNSHENGTITCSGNMCEILEYVKQARNCTYKIIRSPDGQWGHCYGINNCTGMLGLVNRKEADFALGLNLTM